ncbi:hypothetical protein MKW98_022126 [Papaver atlanticum]|uniref:Uncharacterized protein n=1 Tax=Papaver atlanticum TaxID=357466 RepID=A0AAD4T1B8_9MAGN|nr:hypothetical protein MKW98_022126 [Papaver atlanticum]
MNLLMQRMSNRRNLALYDVSELHSLMVQDRVSMDLPTSYDDDNDKIGKQGPLIFGDNHKLQMATYNTFYMQPSFFGCGGSKRFIISSGRDLICSRCTIMKCWASSFYLRCIKCVGLVQHQAVYHFVGLQFSLKHLELTGASCSSL